MVSISIYHVCVYVCAFAYAEVYNYSAYSSCVCLHARTCVYACACIQEYMCFFITYIIIKK